MIRTVHTHKKSLARYLRLYKYQPDLSAHLDALPDKPFSQETINEIVLWKVNRYVSLSSDIRKSLHAQRTLRPKQHRQAEEVLIRLLESPGVDLAMASTFLRFQNVNVFQIIDRHAFRALYGKPYVFHTKTPAALKIATYFSYLDDLHTFASKSGARFKDLDRILFEFDKKHNGTL